MLESVRRACYNELPLGAVAQMGERLNGIQEVSGSIPLGSISGNPETPNLCRFIPQNLHKIAVFEM